MSQKAIFAGYFKHLAAIARQGDAREESFYPALAAMLKAAANDSGRQHVHVTTLPKPTEGGNPDFRLWNGTDRIIGYVEAKRPSEERLDDVENSEQFAALPVHLSESAAHQLSRVPPVPQRGAGADGPGRPAPGAQPVANGAAGGTAGRTVGPARTLS